MRTKIEDGRVLANINDLALWPKNPRLAETENLKRLKGQIVQLGIYKPLVITEDGTILGGNQRYKVIKELYKEKPSEYEYVWVSIVKAWNEAEMIRYAISDNDAIGKHTKEKLMELIPEISGQDSLFEDYRLDYKTIKQIEDEINLTEEQIRENQLKETLKSAGINDETISAVTEMSSYHKNINKIDDVDIVGKQTGERWPITFWCENKEDYEFLEKLFSTSRKYNFNTDLLLSICKKSS